MLKQLETGDIHGGTRRFVEFALGPGMWEQMPTVDREIFINNAPTFLDEQRDPLWASLDLAGLGKFSGAVLFTQGGSSAPWYHTIIARIRQGLKQSELRTLPGAGHIPHVTHPDDYVAAVMEFIGAPR